MPSSDGVLNRSHMHGVHGSMSAQPAVEDEREDDAKMTKVRVLLGVLGVLYCLWGSRRDAGWFPTRLTFSPLLQVI